MPRLLLITNFPACTAYTAVPDGTGTRSYLIERCRKLLREPKYQEKQYMFCVISDDNNWQVLHPVISDLEGGTKHPRQCDEWAWNWVSGRNHPQEERDRSHAEFTLRLRETLTLKPAVNPQNPPTQNTPVKERQGADRSPRKSAAPTPQEAGNEKKNADPDLETSKKIILENFEDLKEAYRKTYHKEFLTSDDAEMFFRRADLKKILKWNENASSQNDLIDLCAFYELSLGTPSQADVVILGNNPGDKGDIERILSFEKIFSQLEDRKKQSNIFYPMSSVEAIKSLPWFPNRLIYGVGGSAWKERQEKDGILYPFMRKGGVKLLCGYADRIATVELVPYHTKNFAAGESFLDEFDLFDPTPVIAAMKNRAVIIALFRNAAERWCRKWCQYRAKHPEVEDLEQYPYFYVNHKKQGNTKAEANASLSRQTLRRYPEFYNSIKKNREDYPSYDAYSEIIDYLKEEKKWDRPSVMLDGSILDCGIAEAAAVIVPPGAAAFRTKAKKFFEQITGRLPQKTVDPAQVKSGNGILRHILYVDTAEHRISGIEDMKKLVSRILETFAGLGVRNVAMNGIRCDDRPDMTIRPEEYQKRFTDQYLAENPGVFDTIVLVDLRGGFGKHKAK